MEQTSGDQTTGLGDRARHIAEEQKDAGAETAGGVADAIHSAAHELESQMPRAAGYVHDAADRLDRAATKLKEQSLGDLLSGVTGFARDQPAAFFGGAVLAGFALSRLLKSSSDGRHGSHTANPGGHDVGYE